MDLNDLLAGPTRRRLSELQPVLDDFVGLRTITAFYSGGILCIDGHHYKFFVAEEYATPIVPGLVPGDLYTRAQRRTWLRTIRRLSIEELHTADLVVVLKPTDLVVQMRVFEQDGSNVLYGIDEKTNQLVLEVGDIVDPTIMLRRAGTSREAPGVPMVSYTFQINPEGITSKLSSWED